MGKDDGYDWLDDPFDEKKAAAERAGAKMGGASKAAVGLGCAGFVILLFVLGFLGISALAGL